VSVTHEVVVRGDAAAGNDFTDRGNEPQAVADDALEDARLGEGTFEELAAGGSSRHVVV
jgi:hypothetical protein